MSERRVLIAEDEESILASLEFVVRAAGHEVRLARDGEQALAALREFRPDLVLLDLMLPRRSGLEVCAAVRADPALVATKVLMLTARGGSNDITRGLAAGADAYMVKPFSTRELGERVRAMLGS
ncbi:MAG TPA: response regulator [Usitatibacter sp.]|nr:response regulator [Usitatibacter sp.]